jgi:serine/threonine-protein kinase
MDRFATELQQSLGDSFVVVAELGGGGMSRVFRATDKTLDRDVVAKMLPADAAAALSTERFKREVALAAKLQHPHIVPLLSAGTTASGLPYYLMPFVEGDSLRARLVREGELPLQDAVSILREVARALGYAHERGIIHRDIKPDNVMLSGGSVMVTDFGVAKAVSASVSSETNRGDAATLTQLGVSLGTPAYMAPEQVAGDPGLDKRADVYAFGCMAYEMLTGYTPFSSRTTSATLAAQVSEIPESISIRRPSVPPVLAALVMQCLEKHAADRPASAQDLLRALDAVVLTPGSGVRSMAGFSSLQLPARRTSSRWKLRAALAAPWIIAACAAGLMLWQYRANGSAAAPPVRFTIGRLSDEGPLLAESWPAVSPDNATIIYRVAIGSGTRLDQRIVGEFASRPVAGTEGATVPFFSDDGKWIAFLANGKLQKMPIDGGPAVLIAESPVPKGAVWTPSGDIILGGATGVRGAGLMRVSAQGGTPTQLTRPDVRSGESHIAPVLLDDGKTLLFSSEDGTGRPAANSINVGSVETGEFTRLGVTGERALGVLGDWLVYTRSDGALMAIQFDKGKRSVHGNPKALGITAADGGLNATLSRGGMLVYSEGNTKSRLVWIDSRSAVKVAVAEPREYEFPRLSPDGSRIAVTIRGALTGDIWIVDVASGQPTRFTTDGSNNDRAEWSADGKRLLFRSTRDSASAMWWQPLDGGAAERLTSGSSVWEGVLSPDNSILLYRETIPGKSGYRLMYRSLSGDSTPKAFSSVSGSFQMPRFSPDGHWIAFQSDESGQFEVYAVPFPSGSGRVRVSSSGGTEPLWSADGHRLYYRNGTALITTEVVAGATLRVTSRQEMVLDPAAQPQSRTHPKYDVARDGRIIMPRWIGEGTTLGAVVNWQEELRRAVRQSR